MSSHSGNTAGDEKFDPMLNTGEAPAGGSEEASAAALRMDLMGASPIDGASAAPPKSGFGGQIAVLVMVVAASGAGLIAMRYLGMGPRSSQGESVKIDYDLNKPAVVVDHRRVLADLSSSRTATQVPPDQVQRNPFRFAGTLAPEAIPDTIDDSDKAAKAEAERRRREAEERQRRIEQSFASLELHMVVGGSNPVARISGQVVRKGDVLNDLFTVSDIEGRSVHLDCDGRTYVLTLAEDGAVRRSTRPRK